MGRNVKKGLDYFPFDLDFYQDIRIRKLIKYQGGGAVAIYNLLLCFIYKDGYYTKWDTELPFIISEQTGFEEPYICKVIDYCLSIGLFDKSLYESDEVLTSKGIQERYKRICELSRRTYVVSEHSLISLEPKAKVKPQKKGKADAGKPQPLPRYEPYTLTLEEEIEMLKNDECWLDGLQVLHSMETAQLRNSLDDFRIQCVADGRDRHQSIEDAKRHFNSWLRIVSNLNKKNDDKNRPNARNQRRGNLLEAEDKKTYGGTF